MQNHLLQILTLVAMEKPPSTAAEDIRNEKVLSQIFLPPPAKDSTEANSISLWYYAGMCIRYVKFVIRV